MLDFEMMDETMSLDRGGCCSSQPRPILNSQLFHHQTQLVNRRSTDSGYDSILLLSHSSSSSSRSPTMSSSSLANTPVKTPSKYSTVHQTTQHTPNRLTADMNGLYLASIRNQQMLLTTSPVRSSVNHHFFNYSTSNSNSPKFDSFLNEKSDESVRVSKLLKSPARFSGVSASELPSPLKVRTFASRLKSEGFGATAASLAGNEEIGGSGFAVPNQTPLRSTTSVAVKTPTEEEFLDMLYRNRHIPPDPNALIGN